MVIPLVIPFALLREPRQEDHKFKVCYVKNKKDEKGDRNHADQEGVTSDRLWARFSYLWCK